MTGTRAPARPRQGAADLLLPVIEQLFGGQLPVSVRAWDGSEAGPAGKPVLVLADRQALRRLLWHPGELGLAQAYVTGELDVDGDVADGLRAIWRSAREQGLAGTRMRPAWAAAARAAVLLRVAGPRPTAPASQARLSGRLHSKRRDQAVIHHHYDLPAEFYQLILDPQMAYSCALWPQGGADSGPGLVSGAGPGRTLEDAQRAKLDAICAKLGLRPGMRLLDVGCGWGSLAIHAARDYGAQVTAVTLAGEQAAFVQRRVAELGLQARVTVLVQDYRDISGEPHDAVTSIEMGEHVGAREYPAFCALLRGQLTASGRLLIQQMSRGSAAPGGGSFIELYIAPDMHMRPVGQTVGLLEDAGLEVLGVQAMREHYTLTIRAWLANLERHWDAAVALIGLEGARVWRLYLAGGALAFEEGRMGVHQILAAAPPA